jgi:hypothetical protein
MRTGAPAARRLSLSMRSSALSAVRPISVAASAVAGAAAAEVAAAKVAPAKAAPAASRARRVLGIMAGLSVRRGSDRPRCRRYGTAAGTDADGSMTWP